MYKIHNDTIIKDSTRFIPMDRGNSDYQEYLAWVAKGNTADAIEDAPTVIDRISMAQCRLILLQYGLLTATESFIDALPEPQKTAVKIEWEYRSEVVKDNALVQMMARQMRLKNRQIDTMFNEAILL